MKISIVTLSLLMAGSIQASAQTKAPVAKPVKQSSDAEKAKQSAKPKKEKTVLAKDSIKPIHKNPDHYYCPPCGMG